MAKKITITLTEAEFGALAIGVDMATLDMEDEADMHRHQLAALNRAWRKVHTAWHAPKR